MSLRTSRVAVRWTIGDVTPRGFEALHLSLWGAWRCFGPRAHYIVVVNTLPVEQARVRVRAPGAVRWRSAGQVPGWMVRHVTAGMAEGVAWKLVPLRVQHALPELSLDNDVILWDVPVAVERWLGDDQTILLAADVVRSFGAFEAQCGALPLNTGIRGLPPRLSLASMLRRVLAAHGRPILSELDEQGMQVAALTRAAPLHVVPTWDVSICSPFPPHQPELGRAGAHFVGVNTRRLGWRYDGRPAEEVRAEHWDRHRAELYQRVGAPPMPASAR